MNFELLINRNLPKRQGEFIPCLFLPYSAKSSKILLYFHGNAEDIGISIDLLTFLRDGLGVSLNKVILILCRSMCWQSSIRVMEFTPEKQIQSQ